MPKTVTIEVPDDLAQQLGVPDDAVEAPLQKLIVNVLSTLAELVRSLQHESFSIRVSAARKLGELGLEAAIPALEKALSDENSIVRSAVVEALQTIGTEEALALLSPKPANHQKGSAHD